jgi:hypothetical protein
MCECSQTDDMLFLCSVYYELMGCTCFEHYLLIFRRRRSNCVGCYQGWGSTPTLVADTTRSQYTNCYGERKTNEMHFQSKPYI